MYYNIICCTIICYDIIHSNILLVFLLLLGTALSSAETSPQGVLYRDTSLRVSLSDSCWVLHVCYFWRRTGRRQHAPTGGGAPPKVYHGGLPPEESN